MFLFYSQQKNYPIEKTISIMKTIIYSRVKFHHLLTLIERDDGNKKNKTLEKEAGLPSV